MFQQIAVLAVSALLALGAAVVPGIDAGDNNMVLAGNNDTTLCHETDKSEKGDGPWIVISVNGAAKAAHLAHGDFVFKSDEFDSCAQQAEEEHARESPTI